MNGRVTGIAPSVTLGITSRAREMAARGHRVFSFAAGEPDFDTPRHVKDAAIRALDAGETKYAPIAGLSALQVVIAKKLQRENGITCRPGQVVISNGAKHALFNLFLALLEPGDEVIIPAPYWVSYPEMVRVAGGVSVFVDCPESNEFKMTPTALEGAITPRTKIVVLNSPSNPTGVVYAEAELRALAEVAVIHGLWIVSDEIYEKFVYDGAVHVSPAALSKEIGGRTITVNGFSKSYAMTGWRLGYMVGPTDVVRAVCALQSHSTSGPNTFAQFGALAALEGSSADMEQMVRAFSERRAYLYNRLAAINGVTCVQPQGAFYVLPNVSAYGMDSVTFAEQLMEQEGVAVVPGISFGADSCVRLSYACGMETIREGMDRFEAFVASI